MKGPFKDPSLFLKGKMYAKHLVNLYSTSIFGGKNEYLAYIQTNAIYVPIINFLNDILFIVINKRSKMEKYEN